MGRWLLSWANPDPALPVLVCSPPAGAGAGQFRSWQQALDGQATVLGTQLPGRESRWSQPPPPDVAHAVSRMTGEILAVPSDVPAVVLGDSFGGLLAFEITAALRRSGRAVASLVVAASRPPDVWATRGPANDEQSLRTLLDTRELGEHMDAEVREIVLEVLRKDIALSKTYAGPPPDPLDVPIHAWSSPGDPIVEPEAMDGWKDFTVADFTRRSFDGGHHFVLDRPETVLPLIAELLRQARLDAGHERGRPT